MDTLSLCDVVRETSFDIHRFLRHGHLEKVYLKALSHRLQKRGLDVKEQFPLHVFDEDGTLLGDFFSDLLIENHLVIELKSCKSIVDEHVAQLLGYLRSARLEHGMLINFGAPKLQVRKYILNDVEFCFKTHL